MRKRRNASADLEREVILSVIILYVLICAAMIGIHYVQPGGTATVTSSSSPSHADRAGKD